MNKQLSSSLLSVTILSAAIGVLWAGYYFTADKTPSLQVRHIDLAVTPPPPPPPPQSQKVTQQAEITMQVEGAGATVEMANLTVDTDIDIKKPDMPQVHLAQTKWDVPEIDWDAYKLSDLDDKPALLTPVKIRFPKALKKRGVEHVLVKLDVMIDESGDVTLIDIVSNPHHELNREIQRFVKGSKFTAPHKGDKAVRARFIWPIEIEA